MTVAVDITLRSLLGLFALVGLGDSLIFARNAIQNKENEVTCADGSCIKLSKTSYARVIFKLPNWGFGIVYYLATLLAAILAQPWISGIAFLGAIISTCFSIYLVYALMMKLKIMCKLCYLAHGVNVALLILWIVIAVKG